MERLIDAIKHALDERNYIAAVLLAVTIPDICGKIEYANGFHYKQWFEANMGKRYAPVNGDDAYAIRCALLHAFSQSLSEQKAHKVMENYQFTEDGAHSLGNVGMTANGHEIPNSIVLSAQQYAIDIVAAYERWRANANGTLAAFGASGIVSIH